MGGAWTLLPVGKTACLGKSEEVVEKKEICHDDDDDDDDEAKAVVRPSDCCATTRRVLVKRDRLNMMCLGDVRKRVEQGQTTVRCEGANPSTPVGRKMNDFERCGGKPCRRTKILHLRLRKGEQNPKVRKTRWCEVAMRTPQNLPNSDGFFSWCSELVCASSDFARWFSCRHQNKQTSKTEPRLPK